MTSIIKKIKNKNLILELPKDRTAVFGQIQTASRQVFIYLRKNSNLKLVWLDQKARQKPVVYNIYLESNSSLEILAWLEANGQGQTINIIQERSSSCLCQIVLAGTKQTGQLRIDCQIKGRATKSIIILKTLAKHSQLQANGKINLNSLAVSAQANVKQSSLLLDPDSSINNCPVLEVATSEVQANHSATFGQLNQNAKNYLMSRGLNKKMAKKILLQNFLSENINWSEQQEFINQKVAKYL